MGIDAFVLRYQTEGPQFRSLFLASPEFDDKGLKALCLRLGLHSSGNKSEIIDRIDRESGFSTATSREIFRTLVSRSKGWVSLKTGKVLKRPKLTDPCDLIVSEGSEQWYGPTDHLGDPDAVWYVRPIFLPHWETQGDSMPSSIQCRIRWMCFARVTDTAISLHWRGFSFSESADSASRGAQFHYWEHIPELFREIEFLTGATLSSPSLSALVLHTLWDKYRYDPSYTWVDQKIRAEASGVSVNAHAGSDTELEVNGIRRFANTIRKQVAYELESHFGSTLPAPERFDEVILRALIREYGALSYQLSLEHETMGKILRANFYLGVKPASPSADSFPHFNILTTWRADLDQLRFLMDNLRPNDYKDLVAVQSGLFD